MVLVRFGGGGCDRPPLSVSSGRKWLQLLKLVFYPRYSSTDGSLPFNPSLLDRNQKKFCPKYFCLFCQAWGFSRRATGKMSHRAPDLFPQYNLSLRIHNFKWRFSSTSWRYRFIEHFHLNQISENVLAADSTMSCPEKKTFGEIQKVADLPKYVYLGYFLTSLW